MIYSLCGKLSHVEDGMFVVECSGVGFACKASATAISCLPPEGSEVFVYTTMTFSAEQGTDLYGFYYVNPGRLILQIRHFFVLTAML